MTDDAIETWPDPDDVASWLETLEARVRMTEMWLAAERARIDECRTAARAAEASPSPEARERLAGLMGLPAEPTREAPRSVDLPETWRGSWSLPEPWTPPTPDERRVREAARRAALNERKAAERARRIALAEKQFGVPFEGVGIDQLMPSIAARLAGNPPPELWRANLPSPLLRKVMTDGPDSEEEWEAVKEERANYIGAPRAAQHEATMGSVRFEELPARPPTSDPARIVAPKEETVDPQHQDEARER